MALRPNGNYSVVISEGYHSRIIEEMIDNEVMLSPTLNKGDVVIVENLPYFISEQTIRELECAYTKVGWKIEFIKDEKKKCYTCELISDS